MAMSQLTISYEERIADIVQYLYSWGGSVLVQVRHISLMKLEVGINIAFNNIELLYNFRAYTYVICMWWRSIDQRHPWSPEIVNSHEVSQLFFSPFDTLLKWNTHNEMVDDRYTM